MKKWRIDIDLYVRYVKLEELVLYSNLLVRDFVVLFITQIIHYFVIIIYPLSLSFIMPPKSAKIKSNPEKHAELSELFWANSLPLKYDDHPCIERDEIFFFAQQFTNHVRNGNAKSMEAQFDQLFGVYFFVLLML